MSNTLNKKLRENKNKKILDSAYCVFCKKGYLNVTMQDIIDECGISRGGIYLYFNSVDEIFKEIVSRRDRARFSDTGKSVKEDIDFWLVLENYLNLQKKRLLGVDGSLLRAMYEYIFSKAEGATKEFRDFQLEHLRKSVRNILQLGVNQNKVKKDNIDALTDHIIIVIEGFGVLALTEVLTDNIIDQQFMMLHKLIESEKV